MTERKLQLVKNKNGYTRQAREVKAKAPGRQKRKSKRAKGAPRAQHSRPKSFVLTPAEAAEAARFRAMTAARAARQAMLRRIMAEVAELDENSPAA